MPFPADVKKSFNLVPGTQLLPGIPITSCNMGHIVEQQSERYKFPTTLTLELTGNKKQNPATLIKHLTKHFKQHHVVYSSYGNPYDCTLTQFKLQGKASGRGAEGQAPSEVGVTCVGRAVRSREIPTLVQQKEKEHEEAQQVLKDMRVIKSRFTTSKCVYCGQMIDPGGKIVRPKEDEGKKGGWMHALCAVKKAQQGRPGTGTHKKRTIPAAAAAGGKKLRRSKRTKRQTTTEA